MNSNAHHCTLHVKRELSKLLVFSSPMVPISTHLMRDSGHHFTMLLTSEALK